MISRLSLRLRLMALVAATLLPLGALSIWSAYSASQGILAQTHAQLTLTASLVASQQDRLADAAEHLLAVITAIPEIRRLERERCVDYMADLRARYPVYGNIGILDLHGNLTCHAGGRQGDFNAADRAYFQDAVRLRRFVMGDLVTGRTMNRPVITFAMPILENGEVRGVAFAGIDVAQMQADLNEVPLPAGVRLVLADVSARIVVERDADGLPPRPPGTPATAPVLREAAGRMVSGQARAQGYDGNLRIFSFQPTRVVGERQFMVFASLDESRVHAATWGRAWRELGVLAAVLALSLAAAWLVGRRMVAEPAAKLEAVASRLAAGELESRVLLAPEGPHDEFGRIAAALNQLAGALQEREREVEAELANTRHAHALLDEINRTLEERVVEATAGLRQANLDLEAFSYSVSHDLRAPLAAIGGFARALAERIAPGADPKLHHYLDRIQAGVLQMEQLIEGLLQLSRTVRDPMEQGRVDLTNLARDTLEALHIQEPMRAVRTTVQEGLAVTGDGRLLHTVMQNLLGNAWKFTSGRQDAVIEVGVAKHEGWPEFYVRDNGVGFDMAHAQRLFKPFQRLHPASEFPGTGIGLATVRRVIERHGGTLRAESAPGQGCTIWFTLPPAV